MTSKERLALAGLKGRVNGHVCVAKAIVRAACQIRDTTSGDYVEGFARGNLLKSVEWLRSVRDIQRTLHNFCKEVGYDRK